MIIPHKAADSQRKSSIIAAVTNIFSGNRHQAPKIVDLQEVDHDQLGMDELRNLVKNNRDNGDLLVHYARRALREKKADDVMAAVSVNPEFILKHCPEIAAHYLVIHRGSHEVFSADQLYKLGQWCESSGKTSYALSIYEQWELAYFDLPELEAVSLSAASLWWHGMANPQRALEKLEIMHRKFRNGKYAGQATDLRDEILGVKQNRQAA